MRKKEDRSRDLKVIKILMIISILLGVATLIIVLMVNEYNSKFKIMISIVYLGLCIFPLILKLVFKWIAPIYISVFYYAFIVLSTLLGTIFGLYDIIGIYDIILHSISGVLLGGFGLYLYSVLNRSKDINIGIIILMIIGLACIGGVVWEIWEFTTDGLLSLNSQRHTDINGVAYIGHEAVKDTMYDLISDISGGIIFSLGYSIYYVKNIKHKRARRNKAKKVV